MSETRLPTWEEIDYPQPDEDGTLELGPTAGRKEHIRRMRKHFDLRPHPRWYSLPRCPRLVAGRRCLLGNPGRVCMCERYTQSCSQLWDHINMWRDPQGHLVMTLEPYGIEDRLFAALVADVAPLGLRVRVEGYSPYYPGHSVLVIIYRTRM